LCVYLRGESQQRASLSHRVVDLELPLLLMLSPLLLFPRGAMPVAGLAGILGLWLLRWRVRGRITIATPLDLPILLLLSMTIQALYPSTDLTLSMPKLYGIVLGVSVYYAVVNGVSTPQGWWLALRFLMVAAVGVAAVGLVSSQWITTKVETLNVLYSRIPRLITSVQSSFGTITGIHPNEVGGTLAFLLPVPVGVILWSVRQRRESVKRGRESSEFGDARRRAMGSAHPTPAFVPSPVSLFSRPCMLAAVALLAGSVLALTQSRSSLMGVGCAVLMLAALRWRRIGYGMVAAIPAVLAIGALVGGDGLLRWAFQLDFAGDVSEKVVGRQEIWNRALYMIQDFPFTGIGLNTFPRVLDALYPSFLSGPDARIPHAHNIYLQTAVDLGLAGLMTFVGICVTVGWQAMQSYRRAEGLTKGAIAGLGTGCLAYLVYGLTDAITLGAKPLFLLWMMVGLIVVANPRLATTISEPRPIAVAREVGLTLWSLYWVVAVLFAAMAYLVVALAATGWAP